MDAMVVNQHALHFKVGLLAVLLIIKLDECVLQAVARALVPNHLARQDGSETTEDQLKILIYFAWQLAKFRLRIWRVNVPCVTGFNLQTKSTFSGGLTSAKGRSPTISKVKA